MGVMSTRARPEAVGGSRLFGKEWVRFSTYDKVLSGADKYICCPSGLTSLKPTSSAPFGCLGAAPRGAVFLPDGQQLQDVSVGVRKVDTATTTPSIYLHVVHVWRWPTPVGYSLILKPFKNRVEVFLTHLKRVMV